MSYKLLPDGSALLDGTVIPPGHRWWKERVQPMIDAGTPQDEDPKPTIEQRNAAIRDEAWRWMAAVPKDRGYDSIESCCSYAQSGVARYQAEALAMIAWRDAVSQALEQMALNPPKEVETWEQVRPLLPQPEAFDWPESVSLPLNAPEKAEMGG